jgi:TRAP-type C4-dicarboxylate transport system permease large subunit
MLSWVFFLDIMSILLILLPIVTPVLKALGFDLIWVGSLTIITVCIGQITPPVGIVVFAVAGTVKDVPMWTIFKGSMWFFYAMIICLVILIIFPQISLILPNTMYGR